MSQLPRGVLTKLTKRHVPDRVVRETLAPADAYADEALHVLEEEEPRLLRWLGTDGEVKRLLRAHRAATYGALAEADHQQLPVEQLVKSLDALAYRLAAVLAVGAVQNEREARPLGWPVGMETDW